MLDIETLGRDPGAVILSIAAVEFDLETGKTGKEFYSKIQLEDSVKHGFEINPATLRWWLEQDPAVLKENITIPKGTESLSTVQAVMSELVAHFEYVYSPEVHVWGNSNRFDMGILIPYIKKVTDRPLWKYSKERDVRTLVSFNPDIKGECTEQAKKDGKDLHNPIVDCKLQIEYCSRIYNSIKNPPIIIHEGIRNTAVDVIDGKIHISPNL